MIMIEIVITTLRQSVMITLFVLLMMIVIEYINVQSRNTWADRLKHAPFLQIMMAALLGVIPGCLGAFTVVSLYTHRMVGLSALVSVMIATAGDEAFVMFALFPGKALMLHAILLATAVVTGSLVQLFQRNTTGKVQHGYVVHDQETCNCFSPEIIIPQLKHPSVERIIFILSAILFIILLATGIIGSQEGGWEKITFFAGLLFLLFVFITVPDHFLKNHLFEHILKKHLLRLFLWTWAVFILLHFIEANALFSDVVKDNTYLMLLMAVLIGIIPQSGPHLVFVTLFSQNMLPFSILLANSIVQDGHGMLPLLAETREGFVKVKLINMLVGLVMGFVLLQLGV